MRNLLLLLLVVLLGAGFYGYTKNPAACRKLGTDVTADFTAIISPGSKTVSSTTEDTNAAPVAVAPDTSKHFQQGFVAPAVPVAPATGALTGVPTLPPQAPLPKASEKFLAYSDYDIALSQARSVNKPMLIEFTGPDWSEYSQELDGDVTSKPEFQKFCAAHFIFLVVNVPKLLNVDDENQKSIKALEDRYGVNLVPTLLIVDTDELQRGRVAGYQAGVGSAEVIAKLAAHIPRN